MVEKIEVVVRGEDLVEAVADLVSAGVVFEEAASRGVDGVEFVSILTTLGPPTIAAIATFYVARVRARKFVKLRYKGLVLEGVTEAAIEKALAQISRVGDPGGGVGRG